MYIVTGISKGLGKAIAELLLSNGESVLGIGRRHSINHPNFSFIECDLMHSSEVENLNLPDLEEPVTLINNAGIIGEIKRLSDQNKIDLQEILSVNTIAPTILTCKVYNQINDKNAFTLVNISSGAANRAIPSWAGYCASKVALNMISEAFLLEEKEKGNSPRVYAVAPGVIDTEMQGQIRSTDEKNFSAVENFKSMKQNDELYSSETAAMRLIQLLNQPYDGQVFYDLRNLNA
jgi:benzil reductase ((S)-benzoin forming)